LIYPIAVCLSPLSPWIWQSNGPINHSAIHPDNLLKHPFLIHMACLEI
jgi:hypothetical protein